MANSVAVYLDVPTVGGMVILTVGRTRVGWVGLFVVLTGLVHGVSAQNPGGGACVPIIDHTELTQAVQEGHGATPFEEPELFPPMQYPPVGGAPLPIIPLIDGRSTALRIYIKEPSGGANCDSNDDGTPDIGGSMLVEVPAAGGLMVPGVLAGGASKTAPDDLLPPWARDQETSTLNFSFLPTGSGAADRVISITSCVGLVQDLSQPGWVLHTKHCVKQEVTVVSRRRPLIGGVPINSTFVERLPSGDNIVLGPPNLASIASGNADRHFWAVWPFPDDSALGAGYKTLPDLGFDWKYCAKNTFFGEGNCGATDPRPGNYRVGDLRADPVFAELNEINCNARFTGRDKKVDYMYGWFREPAVSQGHADRGNSAAIGDAWDDRDPDTRVVFAHENGHLFGMPNRPAGDTTGDIGWDVLARVWPHPFATPHVRPDEFDIMGESLKTDKWVRADDFLDMIEDPKIYERKVCNRPAAPATTSVQSILPIIASIPQSPHDQAFLQSAIETITEVDTTPLPSGDVELQALDASSNVLYSTWAHRNESDQLFMPIPANGELNEVRVIENSVVRVSMLRSEHSPLVSITSPAPAEVLTDTVTISWQHSDADHDELVTNVLYSPDNATMYPIGIRLTGSSLTVSTAHLPSSNDGRIVVRTSDGLNTSVVQVTGLVLGPNRSPSIHIANPKTGQSVRHRDNVVFLAQTDDPEDGINWSTSTVHWVSNIDGAFANGLSANVGNLSPGNHVITATTTDTFGNCDIDTITLFVQP